MLESCGSGCLRSCFLRATTDHETVGAIADILLLITLGMIDTLLTDILLENMDFHKVAFIF